MLWEVDRANGYSLDYMQETVTKLEYKKYVRVAAKSDTLVG